jgi:hypothetical protein
LCAAGAAGGPAATAQAAGLTSRHGQHRCDAARAEDDLLAHVTTHILVPRRAGSPGAVTPCSPE